jgi:hypothetical protein
MVEIIHPTKTTEYHVWQSIASLISHFGEKPSPLATLAALPR